MSRLEAPHYMLKIGTIVLSCNTSMFRQSSQVTAQGRLGMMSENAETQNMLPCSLPGGRALCLHRLPKYLIIRRHNSRSYPCQSHTCQPNTQAASDFLEVDTHSDSAYMNEAQSYHPRKPQCSRMFGKDINVLTNRSSSGRTRQDLKKLHYSSDFETSVLNQARAIANSEHPTLLPTQRVSLNVGQH